MKIGYCVEGGADYALLLGLQQRWCPQAVMEEGKFRGQQFRRRDIPKVCRVLAEKGSDLIIFLRDANRESWREVKKQDAAQCPPEFGEMTVFGVCDSNVECWIAGAPEHLANFLQCSVSELSQEDPSGYLKQVLGLQGGDLAQGMQKIADYVKQAPLQQWLNNKSFEDFYQQLWDYGKKRNCKLENLW